MASFDRPSQRVTAVVMELADEPPPRPTPARAVGGIRRRPRLEGA